MCQLWGEFIEIYVKTDLWRESFQKVPSGDKGKAAQRNIVLKALSQQVTKAFHFFGQLKI